MKDPLDFHNLADARSWALHEAVALRIDSDPAVIERARSRVRSWLGAPSEHPYADAWNTLLSGSPEDLRRALVDKGESMCAHRQASPFAGALDARTRWAILKRAELNFKGPE